jgi:serine phosphatase RsbU (regulator of sigma subunit)/Tfp pilus assembly protein PilF
LKKLFYILLILSPFLGNSQPYADNEFYLLDSLVIEELTVADKELLDSCLTIYHTAKNDTSKINALNDICDFLVHDVWSDYQFIQYNLIVLALNNNPPLKTKKHLQTSLSVSLNNIGLYYETHVGNSSKALEFYHNSLILYEELDNQLGVAILLNRIGQIYTSQGDKGKGLEYYQKSLKLFKELDNKEEISNTYNNLGLHYEDKGDHPQALDFFNESLKIDKGVGNQQGIAMSFSNIGRVYMSQGKHDKALISFIKGLNIFEKMGDKDGISLILNNIGHVYLIQNDAKSAFINAKKSFDIAQEIGFPTRISGSALLLSEVYEKQNKKGEALEMYKLHTFMKDSITNENTKTDAVRQQSKYEYDKQKAVDDAIHDKKIAIEKEGKEKQQIIIYAIAGGITLLTIFLLFIINRLQVTRKQKTLIESQKKVVEEAHLELSVKNNEILDSINYAKRIQTAILPPDKLVKEYLENSFILYKPKDIVAGDFYWMKTINIDNKLPLVLFAVADCTGHGVPGAMLSVVCNNALNRSIKEYNLIKPGEILDKTREIVLEEFSVAWEKDQKEDYVKDGMDIAFCSLQGNKLEYAGANNPLWLIRNGEIIITKANKQPVGSYRSSESFTTHFIKLQKGDSIYIFSDGYIDQFGGEKGKKFKARAFRELLLSIQDKPMEEQKIIIDETFETWKGVVDQVDDVCIIGVKI